MHLGIGSGVEEAVVLALSLEEFGQHELVVLQIDNIPVFCANRRVDRFVIKFVRLQVELPQKLLIAALLDRLHGHQHRLHLSGAPVLLVDEIVRLHLQAGQSLLPIAFHDQIEIIDNHRILGGSFVDDQEVALHFNRVAVSLVPDGVSELMVGLVARLSTVDGVTPKHAWIPSSGSKTLYFESAFVLVLRFPFYNLAVNIIFRIIVVTVFLLILFTRRRLISFIKVRFFVLRLAPLLAYVGLFL